MKTIYKYEIKPGKFTLVMPSEADILHIDMQGNKPFMWVKGDTDLPLRERGFKAFGTGHEITDDGDWIHAGSFLMNGGSLVWHVFEDDGFFTI